MRHFRLLAYVFLICFLTACQKGEKVIEPKVEKDPNVVELNAALKERVRLVKVGESEIREELRIPGSIQVSEQRIARIGAPVTGRITDIDTVLGQQVKQGQTLATLNST